MLELYTWSHTVRVKTRQGRQVSNVGVSVNVNITFARLSPDITCSFLNTYVVFAQILHDFESFLRS